MTISNLDAKRTASKAWLSTDLCRATGITYRQLDYWVRTGLIPQSSHAASGSGDPRWFSFEDAVRCAVVAKLLAAGIGLASIRQRIDEYLNVDGDRIQLTPGVWLLIDLDAERTRLENYTRTAPSW